MSSSCQDRDQGPLVARSTLRVWSRSAAAATGFGTSFAVAVVVSNVQSAVFSSSGEYSFSPFLSLLVFSLAFTTPFAVFLYARTTRIPLESPVQAIVSRALGYLLPVPLALMFAMSWCGIGQALYVMYAVLPVVLINMVASIMTLYIAWLVAKRRDSRPNV